MIVLDKLFKPLEYIQISHSEKRWFDWVVPLFFAIIMALIIRYLPKPIALIGKDGMISLVNGMLQILSGFYIASMAAVATFQREGMDDKMHGKAATLNGKSLTRRNFLTYLFGYLAFMSIFLYFAGGFIQLASSSVTIWATGIPLIIKYIFVAIYLFFVFNILCTTILGMHFMIDKIHRSEPTLINKNATKKSPPQ